MSPAFIAGCRDYLSGASVTFDKFHVLKEVNKAMDELRKLERQGNQLFKGHKYTLLKSKLTPKLQDERDLLLEYYPRLGEEYRLKQLFTEFWDMKDKEEAESFFRTIKHEWLYRFKYSSYTQLYDSIEDYVYWYNSERLHFFLGYLIPLEMGLKLKGFINKAD